MPLYLHNGALVVVDGALGAEQACCCGGGVCCGPDCSAGFSVDFIPDAGVDAAFSAFLSGKGYSNVQYIQDDLIGNGQWFADCCKTGDTTEDFEVTGTNGGVPQSTTFSVVNCVSTKTEGTDCVEGLTEQECLDLFGTINSAASCTPDPCSTPCDECYDECVMFLQGRTGSGFISDPPVTELWGLFGLSGYWSQLELPSATPEDLADKSYTISVGNIACEEGKWVIGELLGGVQVSTSVASSYESLTGIETTHNYRNVKVIVGENGCPSGLELGDFDVQTQPNGPSIHPPLEPDIVIDCNPFP